jgi:hypothetical protein
LPEVVHFEDYYNTELQDSALSGVIVTCTTEFYIVAVLVILKITNMVGGKWHETLSLLQKVLQGPSTWTISL